MQRKYSHGTIQAAVTKCLLAQGKNPTDVSKMMVLGSLYAKRRIADYDQRGIIEDELKISLNDLNTILSVVT